MNDIVLDRRSIRKFKTDGVTAEQITQMLDAGFLAPSAMNKQPCSFVYIDKREVLDKIDACHPYASGIKTAPLCIIVCADITLSSDFLPHDSAAATENILIKAHQLGLGSVWCALHPVVDRMQPITEILSLPENIVPFSLIIIGHPDEVKTRPERFAKSRVHHNKW